MNNDMSTFTQNKMKDMIKTMSMSGNIIKQIIIVIIIAIVIGLGIYISNKYNFKKKKM